MSNREKGQIKALEARLAQMEETMPEADNAAPEAPQATTAPESGMKEAVVTVAGLSVPHGNYTRVVRMGGKFEAPAEFVDAMIEAGRCEAV